jgi:hypothetical protein
VNLDFGGLFDRADFALDGLHVSRAGDFYWPAEGESVNHYPPGAPMLTAGQVRARIVTGEIRKVRANG